MSNSKNFIFSGKFLYDKKVAVFLWFGLSIATIIQNLLDIEHKTNIYKIFKHAFVHAHQQVNLYLQYPLQHDDVFLYGPTFSILIAPFALLPDWLGLSLWVIFNVSILFYAIKQLPIKAPYQNAILILASHEMMNASSWLQFNATIAACIILGFVFILRGKENIALLFIVFATITKIYGIVAFSFFFFSNNKIKFMLWSAIWSAIWFIAPIIFMPFSFLLETYHNWYDALMYKSTKNVTGVARQYYYQDISVMGLIRRNIDGSFNKDGIILFFASIIFLLKYTKYKFFHDTRYQLYFLCSVLLFVVIFSTGSESPTYIIAFPACCIWFILQPKSKWVNVFFIFCLLIVSFSYSDLLTKYTREFSMQHSLKALPCFILWLIIIYQILSNQFLKVDLRRITNNE